METAHDIPPTQAPAVLAALQAQAAEASTPPLTDEQREARHLKLEQASAELLRNARRWDNRVRWQNSCPHDLQRSDWDAHVELAPYRPAIDSIIAYQIGAKGILASGPTARGKTRAMWQLMHRLGVGDGHDIRYWTAIGWFTALQERINFGRDEARGWVETVARRHVVFIDDYGQEAVIKAREDWAQSWFFHFLDIRVGEKLPLFVTTNLKSEQMATRAGSIRGDPLVRRLLDLSDPVPFETSQERTVRVAKLKTQPSSPVSPP